MSTLKILLYGDVNLNIIDGSSVWLTSLANCLSLDRQIDVTVLLKSKIVEEELVRSIDTKENVRIIEGPEMEVFRSTNRLNPDQAVKAIQMLNKKNSYDCIIVRGDEIATKIVRTDLARKVIPYITNFTHDKDIIQQDEINELRHIYDSVTNMFVQTPEMKEYLQNILDVKGDKFLELSPMIPNSTETKPCFKNFTNTLVYAGKFAKNWFITEMISVFDNLQASNIKMNVIGSKFQQDILPYKEQIVSELENNKDILWYKGLQRQETIEIIKKSDIGIGWRSTEVDNDESLELSTKILEYGIEGKPYILRRTKLHERLLGKNYLLFVDDEKEAIEKLSLVLNKPELYYKTASQVYKASLRYTYSATYERLKKSLWLYASEQKQKIVFAGHDLKFVKLIIDRFKINSDYEVKIDQWAGHSSHDEKQSKECLEWADIIFCEWGLGNAAWYSQQKKSHQKLVVRMHLQERDVDYYKAFNLDNIDKFIAISPYIYEEFSRTMGIPRNKMMMIYNYIDTQAMKADKNDEAKYNIGIMGILPERKRLDLAIDIIEKLYENNPKYKLIIKGKKPQDVPWLWKRKTEREYYEKQFLRIENSIAKDNIIFDGFSPNIRDWFKSIGYMLSTSDFESFHLAPMEGAASGSIPVVRNWPGCDTIYPKEVIFQSVDQMVNFISQTPLGTNVYEGYTEKFDVEEIYKSILNLIESIN